MQSTRARIIDLLRQVGGATVDDITRELALAPATVRRHLDVLLRDGLVQMRSERVPLGRPHFVFTLTENGRESLPGHQLHLVAAVIEAVRDLSPADTQGRTGREVAALVFERFSARLVAQCQRVVTASDLDSRVEQTLEVLSVAGLEFELDRCEEGYLVRGGACPCTRLLTSAEACGHEAGVLSGLIGSEVVMVQAAGNQESPAYLVRAAL